MPAGGSSRMRRAFVLLFLLFTAGNLRGDPAARTVLVFPFENQSARPDLSWISESFAEVLSTRLSAPTRYALGREERKTAYSQLGIPPETPLTIASSYKIAQTLGADWVVVGGFDVEGERMTARARLLDLRQLKLRPEIEVSGDLEELVDLQVDLAWRLLAAHDPGFTVHTEEDFRRRLPEVRLDAFENYIRGVLAADGPSRVRFLTEADRLDPTDHRASFELGRYYFDEKDYVNSAKWLKKLVETDRDYLEALFRLGVDEFFLGQDPAAEKAFETLAAQIPLNEVWNDLGVIKVRRGRYSEALADFGRASQGDPGDADFSFNQGACLWYLGRFDEAARQIGMALDRKDDDPAAHTLLAVVLGKLGDAEGERRQRAWLAEHEGSPMASEEDILPRVRIKKNYDSRAFRFLSLAVRNASEERMAGEPADQHASAHLARGKQFLAEGLLPEAERELTEAVSLLPKESEARLALGETLEEEGRHQEATTELETSLKLNDSVTAHLWLARAYLALDRPEAARSQGQAALQLDPANQDAERLVKQIRARAPAARREP
jgi:tetratricopeptide (TPR) repeat protein